LYNNGVEYLSEKSIFKRLLVKNNSGIKIIEYGGTAHNRTVYASPQ
jgi:hypothetical protein